MNLGSDAVGGTGNGKGAGVAIVAGLASDVGLWRSVNEDSAYAGRSIWVVADGMGGHAAGEVASALAIDAVRRFDRQDALTQDDLYDMVDEASEAIRTYGEAHPESYGLGTTLCGLAAVDVAGPCWAVFNVGDSRVYRFLGGRLERATIDHTEVELLVRAGVITPAQARYHPARNVVTQSLGSYPPPYADLWVVPAIPGERYLICSDGLTGELTDEEIAEALAAAGDPQQAADTLVGLAVAAGGHDNITALIVDPGGAVPSDDSAEDDLDEADGGDAEPTVVRTRPWVTS